ncbi:RagB/SusD family nutrient uptake outer membrane protein [Flammeovirga aprica]|uniref:RagB/SusD family nutrient uptake outer membrane protein n=1 Tax=Flammeovirga aprica JL-4 TaxID=694437 RepID=A0A7X9X9C2_9BACT|nr:RagB/SusD family nutrient uptake outer membrane protein [Flammeovirga aprica]NME68785.1 RagB/SusD family nutrient uptake outer membrane protein [Flammeovirga aprica JL-4]
MKLKNIISIFGVALLSSCTSYFLDLDDPAQVTEDSYFNKPYQFREAANAMYAGLPSFRDADRKTWDLYGYGNDLMAKAIDDGSRYGYGDYSTPLTHKIWDKDYSNLRTVNKLIEFAENYEGDQADIMKEVAEAKFFRAYYHFELMQYFGGVTVVTKPLSTDSEELYAKRNSRYEVTAQIIEDLNAAIPNLPLESSISDGDKGQISQGVAKAFKARVLLHEATWMKFVGTKTDGDGTSEGAGSEGYDQANINIYLAEAAKVAKEVMDDPYYQLFDYNTQLENMSSFFLFNLDASSNPVGVDKSINREFIFVRKHDMALFHDGNPSQVGRTAPTRKMMDMILCSDGLPIEKSAVFQGYVNASDEFINRDYRMKGYFSSYNQYGDYTDLTTGLPTNETILLAGFTDADAGGGYKCHKYTKWGQNDNPDVLAQGGLDYPIIRLPEVYLTYAEALYELNGTLSDTELDASINKTRARAGIPPLTNAFISANALDVQEEIRREWAIEFYSEGKRYHNLKRWGIAEQELGDPLLGMVVGGTPFENDPAKFKREAYPNEPIPYTLPNGETKEVIVVADEGVRNFSITNYLRPVPTGQILLNENLTQNPGY